MTSLLDRIKAAPSVHDYKILAPYCAHCEFLYLALSNKESFDEQRWFEAINHSEARRESNAIRSRAYEKLEANIRQTKYALAILDVFYELFRPTPDFPGQSQSHG